MCLQIGLFFDNHWEGIREAGNMSHYKKKKINYSEILLGKLSLPGHQKN